MLLELNYLNLHDYNFGTLLLPNEDSEIDAFFEALNPNGNHDLELQWVETNESLKCNYNDLSFSQLKELSEIDDIKTFDMVFYATSDFDEAMSVYTNTMYTIIEECSNDYDLGYFLATEYGYVDESSKSVLHRYFDYEAFGRDCRFEGNFTQYDYDTMVEIQY